MVQMIPTNLCRRSVKVMVDRARESKIFLPDTLPDMREATLLKLGGIQDLVQDSSFSACMHQINLDWIFPAKVRQITFNVTK